MAIEILNLTKQRIYAKLIRKAVELTLRRSAINEDAYLNVVFVGKGKIRELNRIYGGKNEYTDVLSFHESEKFPLSPNNAKFIGEVFVCPEIVRKNSEEFGTSFKRELVHVVVHGTLHLLGHHHEGSEKKRLKMHSVEEDIINSFLAS